MKPKYPSDRTLLVLMSNSNKMNLWIELREPSLETLHRMYHLELKRREPRKRILEKIEAKFKKVAVKVVLPRLRISFK